MKGPDVKDWVQQQMIETNAKLTRPINPYDRDTEALWDEFKNGFIIEYTDTDKQGKAQKRLFIIQMRPGKLDTYVALFRNLAHQAENDVDARGTIDIFVGGLPTEMRNKIIEGGTPTTFDGWV